MGDQFPAGLRVLVVDDDRTCLAILKKMLLSCAYNVTTCGMARLALAMLRENRERFDVVLSDVYMPDMDGFKLLELVGLEMDLPVIMMSADGETSLVMKGITHGACDYLLKPIRIKELKNIWQHVIRKRKNFQIKDVDTAEHDKHKQRKCDEVDSSIPSTSTKKRKEVKDDDEDPELDIEDSSALKKPRVVWSVELHQQFVTAVNQLGIDKAVPKRILELMNVQGLTRENVASHLQKYRLYLKRLSVAQQQQHQTPVMAIAPEPPFSSVEGLQPHPIITPASSQALAALRSAYLRTLCPPSEPPLSGVESPVFVVRPRSLQPSNQRNMLLGGGHDDGNQLPQSQIVSVGQLRPSQEVLIPSSTVVGTQSNSSSLAEQLIHQQQVPHYNQKQGGDSYLDYSSFKEPSELTTRNTTIEDSIITLPNRSFSSSILAPGGISVIVSSKPPSLTSLNNGIIKCEATDPLSSWESGTTSSSYGAASQLNWPEQPSSDFLQSSSIAPDTLGSEIMQRQEYLGAAICPPRMSDQLGMNSFKVKQEHSYDTVAIGGASQFTGAGSHLHDEFGSPGLTYKQEQDSAGFFDNELGLEGYIPPGNLYVK